MPMQQSPYYTDPAWGEAGSSLATALFGNPELRAKQQQMQAEAELRRAQTTEATQHGRLYGYQGDAANSENQARAGLPGVMADLFAPQMGPTPPPSPDDGAPIPQAAPVPRAQVFRDHLPALAAAMLGSGQHGNDVASTIQALGAYADGDETARRALVAGGHSPTAAFAITPERADTIAANEAGAKQAQAFGVADRSASASRYGADQRLKGTRYASDNTLAGARYSADQRGDTAVAVAGMKPGAIGNSLAATVSSLFPGARITDGDRTQATQDEYVRRGWSPTHNSNHIPSSQHQAIDMEAIPGQTLASVVAGLQAKGATVIEARDETAPGQGSAPHWHIATLPIPAPPVRKPMGVAAAREVEYHVATELNAFDSVFDKADPKKLVSRLPNLGAADMDGPTKMKILARASDVFQTNGGNAADAAMQAVLEYRNVMANGGRVRPWVAGQPLTPARRPRNQNQFIAPTGPAPAAPAAQSGVEQWDRDAHGKLVRVR